MSKRVLLVLLAGCGLILGTQTPAQAQSFQSRSHHRAKPLQQHSFVPNFGLRPVIQERFPVFGLGFDAQHFHAVRRHHLRRRHGFGLNFGFSNKKFFFRGGFGTGFHGLHGFGSPFVTPFVTPFATSTVVVPQQQPQGPQTVIIQNFGQEAASATQAEGNPGGVLPPPGLPANWSEVRIEEPSYAKRRPPVDRPTLLVLKDDSIRAVQDYWLDGDLIVYVTSTGRQDSFPVGELDWEMTIHLNEQRHISFVLRSEP